MKEQIIKNDDVVILGIESSCDDTSAAIIRDGYLLSNVISIYRILTVYYHIICPIKRTLITK